MDEQDPELRPYEEALQLVEETIGKVKTKVETKTGSSADLCRLLQLEIDLKRSIEARRIREVKVTWVDPQFVTEQ